MNTGTVKWFNSEKVLDLLQKIQVEIYLFTFLQSKVVDSNL